MNERIRELADQALKECDVLDALNRFAELIVRECMWKIMQRKEEAIDNDWHVDEAMSAAMSDISEHFGVEE